MTISKRVLTKWRKEALNIVAKRPIQGTIGDTLDNAKKIICADRILLLTQELLDQHLLKEANKDA